MYIILFIDLSSYQVFCSPFNWGSVETVLISKNLKNCSFILRERFREYEKAIVLNFTQFLMHFTAMLNFERCNADILLCPQYTFLMQGEA